MLTSCYEYTYIVDEYQDIEFRFAVFTVFASR